MGNLAGFDAAKVEPARDILPAGEYTVVIAKSELKPTSNKKGQRLSLELQIVDGKYKGRKLFDGLNIQHESAQTQQIGQAQLSSLCRAVGVMQPKDSSDLHNKPVVAVVKIGKDQNGGDRAEVKSYKAVGGGSAAAQPSLVEQAFEASEPKAKSPWE